MLLQALFWVFFPREFSNFYWKVKWWLNMFLHWCKVLSLMEQWWATNVARVKLFDAKWNASWIVLMIYEPVETGSSSCYCTRLWRRHKAVRLRWSRSWMDASPVADVQGTMHVFNETEMYHEWVQLLVHRGSGAHYFFLRRHTNTEVLFVLMCVYPTLIVCHQSMIAVSSTISELLFMQPN